MEVEIVSKTKQKFNGIIYYLSYRYFQSFGGKRLHQEVWKYHKGDQGTLHIHHKDGDRANNQIENLILKSPVEHLKAHKIKRQHIAALWHGSKEGLAFHSKLAKDSWKTRKK